MEQAASAGEWQGQGQGGYAGDLDANGEQPGSGPIPGQENFGEEDFANMEEVERALAEAEASQYGHSVEEMEAMAQLQAEMDKEVDDEDETGQNSVPPSPDNQSGSGGRTNSNGSNSSPRSRAVVPEGAMPSRNGVLSQHAAEFWFPECRNCPCCKGFKHGCACRSPVQDTCSDPNCVDPEHAAAVRARPPSQPSPSSSDLGPKSYSEPTHGRHLPPPRGAPSDESAVPCRFFNSPNGCRFGATCRHAHSGPGGGDGGGGAPYMHHAPRGMPRGYSDGAPMYPPNPGNPMMGQRGGGGGWAPHMGMGGPGMGGGPMGGGGMHHGSSPQGGSREPCTFFQQGSCRFGAACRFAHGP